MRSKTKVSIDSVPAAAKAVILKRVATGKLDLVETVTKGKTVFYEAHYTAKSGKKGEVLANADGSPAKD